MAEGGVGRLLAPAAWKARAALGTVALIATLLALDLSSTKGDPTSQASQGWLIAGGIVGVVLGVATGLSLRRRAGRSDDEHRRPLSARATWSYALVAAAVAAMLRLGPILLQIGTMSAFAGFSLALLPFVSSWFAAREGNDS